MHDILFSTQINTNTCHTQYGCLPILLGELLAIPSEERDAILGTFTITRNVADPTAAAMPKLVS